MNDRNGSGVSDLFNINIVMFSYSKTGPSLVIEINLEITLLFVNYERVTAADSVLFHKLSKIWGSYAHKHTHILVKNNEWKEKLNIFLPRWMQLDANITMLYTLIDWSTARSKLQGQLSAAETETAILLLD